MKHTFLRRTGALLLALILALSLAPAALAEDAYTITPAAWTLEVGQTAELTAQVNGGPLPSGVSVEWTGTDAVSIKENYGNIVQIQADARRTESRRWSRRSFPGMGRKWAKRNAALRCAPPRSPA